MELFYLFELYQVRREKGIAESVWDDKRQAIANEIESLGEGYRDLLRAGWVQYLQNANAQGGKIRDCVPKVSGKVVVEDDD